MVKRSVLSSFRDQQLKETVPDGLHEIPHAASSEKSSRRAKLHIGGYFDPTDQTIIAFQKLKIDLRQSQQEMLLEALRDFVAKQRTAQAFR